MRTAKRALTLLELLISTVIIIILSGLALINYSAALESTAVKLALPVLANQLNNYQQEANRERSFITVICPEGRDAIIVTRNGPRGVTREVVRLDARGILGRRLYFRRYRWPDGSKAPRTFTFFPMGTPQGGAVWLGTLMAQGKIMVSGNGISWEL